MNHPEVNTRVDLTKLMGRMGFRTGAEIGVCKGKFSRVFCWNIPNVKLYCIDTWKSDSLDPHDHADDHEKNYIHAKAILSSFDVTIIRMTSMEAVNTFPDGELDFVYIDANHSFDFVIRDLIEWSKKVRSGGIVSGHDYYRLKDVDVITAVDAYVKTHKIDPFYITPETPHSFFWMKP